MLPRGQVFSRHSEYTLGFSAQPKDIRTVTVYIVQVGHKSHEKTATETLFYLSRSKNVAE